MYCIQPSLISELYTHLPYIDSLYQRCVLIKVEASANSKVIIIHKQLIVRGCIAILSS